MKTFQINDEDGNSLGILSTTLDENSVDTLYHEFCTNEDYDDVQGDIEEFIIFCQSELPSHARGDGMGFRSHHFD